MSLAAASSRVHRGIRAGRKPRFTKEQLALCESLNYRRMVGLLHRQRLRDAHETDKQRHPQFAALIEIFTALQIPSDGADRPKFVNRVISRTLIRCVESIFTAAGAIRKERIDDGTITRWARRVSLDAAGPASAMFQQNTLGWTYRLKIFRSNRGAGAAGPTSGKLLHAAADACNTN